MRTFTEQVLGEIAVPAHRLQARRPMSSLEIPIELRTKCLPGFVQRSPSSQWSDVIQSEEDEFGLSATNALTTINSERLIPQGLTALAVSSTTSCLVERAIPTPDLNRLIAEAALLVYEPLALILSILCVLSESTCRAASEYQIVARFAAALTKSCLQARCVVSLHVVCFVRGHGFTVRHEMALVK